MALLATHLLVWGTLAHWIADWPLQNNWIAVNKIRLTHPAAWVHGGIHFAALVFVFPWYMALALAAAHILIDTRIPLNWWRKTFHVTGEEPMALHVAIWMDQVVHIMCIAGAALLLDYLTP